MSVTHQETAAPGVPPPQAEGGAVKVAPGEIAIGVVIGRISEFFDFFVFGIASVLVFPAVFFPFVSPMQGTIYSFMLFSLAFIARPFGSLAFRVIHQRYGRGTKLTVALFMLGTSTVTMAFLPGYNDMGAASIVFLALLRFAQGIAVGGSWDGLPSLLALNAPENRRGWYAMIPQLGAPAGFLIATALFAYLLISLEPADFNDWGWRYPFYVAFAINVVALFARLRLVMTPEFEQLLKTRELEPAPLGELMRTQGANIALGAFAPLASYALFHMVTVFPLCWVLLFTKLSMTDFLLVQVIGGIVAVPCMIISGLVADRFGRRTTLGVSAVLIGIYSGYTPMLLNGSAVGGYAFIIIGFALLGLSHAQAAGAVNSAFPSRFRYSGAVFTSDLGWLAGAAFAPLLALELALHLGAGWVALYMLSGTAGTLGALYVNRSLEMKDD